MINTLPPTPEPPDIMESTSSSKEKGQKRTMSSYKVFLKFAALQNGKEPGENILSKEAFEMWLSTRDHDIVHPEASFRRTLISHLRGVFKRKPFPKYIEDSLLKVLQSCEGKTNPWNKCFDADGLSIGKRKFRQHGYHQSKALKKAKTEASSDEKTQVVENISELLTEPLPAVALSASGVDSSPQIKQQVRSVASKSRTTDPSGNFEHSIVNPVAPEEDKNGKVDRLYDLSSFKNPRLGFMTDFAKVLTSFYSQSELIKLLQVAEQRGVDILSPSVCFYLESPNQLLNESRFNLRRIIPPTNECKFAFENPVGSFMLDFQTWLVLKSDAQCQEILGGNISNLHMLQIVESPLEFLFVYLHFYPILRLNGEAWIRCRLKSRAARSSEYLCRIVLVNSKWDQVYIQKIPESTTQRNTFV